MGPESTTCSLQSGPMNSELGITTSLRPYDKASPFANGAQSCQIGPMSSRNAVASPRSAPRSSRSPAASERMLSGMMSPGSGATMLHPIASGGAWPVPVGCSSAASPPRPGSFNPVPRGSVPDGSGQWASQSGTMNHVQRMLSCPSPAHQKSADHIAFQTMPQMPFPHSRPPYFGMPHSGGQHDFEFPPRGMTPRPYAHGNFLGMPDPVDSRMNGAWYDNEDDEEYY